MSNTVTVETLAAVQARQVVWPEWMAKATAGCTSSDLVEVTTKVTPFGSFVLALVPLPKPGSETSPLMLAGEALARGGAR